MATDAYRIKKRLRIEVNGTASDTSGELRVNSSGDLLFHNGSSEAALVRTDGLTELSYDNLTSGLTAENPQAALDEITARVDATENADGIVYDNAASGLTATDVQAAIDEVDDKIDDHIEDTTAAHAASAVSFDETATTLLATDVQAAIEENSGRLDTAESDIDNAQNDITDLQQDVLDLDNNKINNTLVDAKGDLISATADNTPARLAVGSNGQVLIADSGESTGLRWGSAPAPTIAVDTYTSAQTLTTANDVVLVDATSGDLTITLPTAVGNEGKIFKIKKTDTSNNVITIDGNGSEQIDGAATRFLRTRLECLEIISNNADWDILTVRRINKRQEKNLSSNVNSITTRTRIADLSFSGLVVGVVYNLYVSLELATDSAAPSASVRIEQNGLDIASWNFRDDTHGATRLELQAILNVTFVAGSTSVDVDVTGSAGTWRVEGASNGRARATLTEFIDAVTTTQWS